MFRMLFHLFKIGGLLAGSGSGKLKFKAQVPIDRLRREQESWPFEPTNEK